MPKQERIRLIEEIEKDRNSVLITYLTNTRPNLEILMAMDQIRVIFEHVINLIDSVRQKPNIDLFINTHGGDGTVPWRLVTLLREYSSKFSVLIPYRCFSAGTLTALGADEIVMHQMGMLGPTDPTAANEFNPPDPAQPDRKLGINVEDVSAYLALIKEDAGIRHEDELIQGFKILAEKVHPLALGNVKRLLAQSRMMAKKLLCLHMKGSDETHKINEIVDKLTSKLYFHGHPINRLEAKNDIGLETIIIPSEKLEKLMWELYLDYEKEMKICERFDPVSEFLDEYPDQSPGTHLVSSAKSAKFVYIESKMRSDVYMYHYAISGTRLPDGRTDVIILKRKEGWEREE
ncbi:MAG: hypothetical protein QHH14_11230 [Clostridiales bacterium]|jgi:hypothetical protein|nr:hypothetical protein [Clostridiales bacterium]